jgi:uncharacterized protein
MLYGRLDRPAVCSSLKPSPEMCGSSREEALAYLAALEEATAPPPGEARSPPGGDSIPRRCSS